MRYTISIVILGLLAACAGSPPKPPEVKGDYRPINRDDVTVTEKGKTTNQFGVTEEMK